ncbi:MAG TPA: tetratricopeptide repeat protein [Trueperaceae bacterium]|nr:tetratricopeptide repeat protein [Trueperaceae bacterium]
MKAPRDSQGRARRVATRLALAALLALAPLALAQRDAFEQMRTLLATGYYNSAARLNGPDLVAQYPNEAEAHYLYARALYLTGDYAGARSQLDRAIELANGDDPAYSQLDALLMAAEGDPAGALRLLKNAFLRTRDYQYAMDWGRVAWQAAEYDEALEAFRMATETDEGMRQPWPYLDAGRVLMLTGRIEEAIAQFNMAIEVYERHDPGVTGPGSPAYVEAFFRLGEAYEALGQPEQAEVNYRAARTADPNYMPAVAALDRLSRTFE